MRRLLLAALLTGRCLTSPAFAQGNLLDYAKAHGSIVSGVLVANGQRSEFVSVALDHDFDLYPNLRGFVGLKLFSRQRTTNEGSVPVPGIPVSLDGLAAYSEGEGVAGVYRALNPRVAIECRGGMTFAMVALTGHDVGAPVDGSKFLGACGLRLTGSPGHLSVLAGHYGPVIEGAGLLGFLPSVIFSGEFRLSDSMTFLVHVAAGRDRATQAAVTSSRFAVKKGF